MEDGQYRDTYAVPDVSKPPETYQLEQCSNCEGNEAGECVEFIGPIECWNQIGMRIRWTFPEVPGEHVTPPIVGETVLRVHDTVEFKLCLECKKPVRIRDVTAIAWTHLFHANNHEGVYREIQLKYDEKSRKWDDNGVTSYEFKTAVSPTHQENFRMTFIVKYQNYVLWVNKFQLDHILTIYPIRPGNKLIESPRQIQITKHISIGNYLCSLLADEMGYNVVLNLDKLSEEQREGSPSPDFIIMIRLFSDLNAGAGSTIPEENLLKVVKWLKEKNDEGQKILVSDHCGLGRAASTMTAYIYANNPNLTYDEAYEYVKRRSPRAFCHKGLRELVNRLYLRD